MRGETPMGGMGGADALDGSAVAVAMAAPSAPDDAAAGGRGCGSCCGSREHARSAVHRGTAERGAAERAAPSTRAEGRGRTISRAAYHEAEAQKAGREWPF